MLPEHRQQIFDTKSKLIGIDWRRKDVVELTFYNPTITEMARPGQFVMIEAEGFFLRRPMSIYNVNDKDLHILLQVTGEGTKQISSLKLNDTIRMLGPIGNGYPLPDKSLKPILLAGGMGIAPLYFLYTRLINLGFWPNFFYGENRGEDTVLANIIPGGVNLASLDGRAGYEGYITDSLDAHLRISKKDRFIVYACGPKPMYKAMASMDILKDIPTLISLEERMACGLGACMGCSVKTRNGYKRVCKDGPVFFLNELELDNE